MRATGIVSLYPGDKSPLLDSKPLALIADLTNEYVWDMRMFGANSRISFAQLWAMMFLSDTHRVPAVRFRVRDQQSAALMFMVRIPGA
jgi:hypothetical protein